MRTVTNPSPLPRGFSSTKPKTKPKPRLVMKPIIPFALLGALLAVGTVNAASTTPVGYVTQALSQGFNLVGLSLHSSSVATGNFETVAGTALTDTGVTFAPVAGRTYVLEITSGALLGSIQEVPAASISGSTITTTDNLQTAGLVVGDTYNLRLAPTLEETFTTAPLGQPGGVLKAALNATGSDNVWVPNGTGGYDKYFLNTSGAFRRITGPTTSVAAPNVPLIYTDGILVEKREATAAGLTVVGEVKKVGTTSVISQGFNLVSVVAPVGLTLRTAGLEDDLLAALNPTGADNVWVQQPNLTYKKYFRHTGSGGNWRDVAAPTVTLDPLVDPALSPSILIERRTAGSVPLDLNVPTGYSGL